jgi:N-acetylmuramoyl-L-alanine amidase
MKKSFLKYKKAFICLAVIICAFPLLSLSAENPADKKAEKAAPPPEKKIIVLDPGHGGKDFGAQGQNGLKEKDIVLDISLRLKKELEDTGYFNVFLTRKTDEAVSHEQRKRTARFHKPDAFICIHCNGNRDKRVKGTTVYILSKRGETATIQNALTEGDYVFNGKESKSNEAEANSTMAKTMKQSERLAHITLSNLLRQLGTHRIGVKRAAFKMLKILDVPSILVEVAFITNAAEENLLSDGKFRAKAAAGIKESLLQFYGFDKLEKEKAKEPSSKTAASKSPAKEEKKKKSSNSTFK